MQRNDASPFTRRELEILALMSQGQQIKEVAHDLCLSQGTIKCYLSSMYKREKIANVAQAVAIYTEWRTLQRVLLTH